MHWAVLGAAHRAELCLLVDISRKSFVVILAGPLRIKREIKLLVPVEGVAGPAEFVVTVAGTGAVTGDVGGVGSDLVGDQALAHIFGIRRPRCSFGVT